MCGFDHVHPATQALTSEGMNGRPVVHAIGRLSVRCPAFLPQAAALGQRALGYVQTGKVQLPGRFAERAGRYARLALGDTDAGEIEMKKCNHGDRKLARRHLEHAFRHNMRWTCRCRRCSIVSACKCESCTNVRWLDTSIPSGRLDGEEQGCCGG